MNTPNPLVPQGALPDNRGKSHIRIAVFTILAIHVVLLGALLLQGCKRTTDPLLPTEPTNATSYYPPPTFDTNPPPAPSTVDTNPARFAEPPPVTPPLDTLPPVVTPEPPPISPGAEHVVIKGDSFSVMAKKYSVTSRAIAQANPGVDPTKLKIGQKLVIPAPSAVPQTIASNGTAPSNGGQKTYTVKSGDTLTKIAKDQRTTVKAIQSANGLKTQQIKVGQKIKIPVKAAAPASDPGLAPAPTSTNIVP